MAIHARFFGGPANWHVEPLADIHRTPPRTLRVEVDGVQLDYTFVRSTTHEQSMGRVDRIQADYAAPGIDAGVVAQFAAFADRGEGGVNAAKVRLLTV